MRQAGGKGQEGLEGPGSGTWICWEPLGSPAGQDRAPSHVPGPQIRTGPSEDSTLTGIAPTRSASLCLTFAGVCSQPNGHMPSAERSTDPSPAFMTAPCPSRSGVDCASLVLPSPSFRAYMYGMLQLEEDWYQGVKTMKRRYLLKFQ